MTRITITGEDPATIAEYARVPGAFTVRETLAVVAPGNGLGGLRLVPRSAQPPWVKDYDVIPGNHPTGWPRRFAGRRWGIVAAWDGAARVGGAVVVHDERPPVPAAGVEAAAMLHDIRVAPAWRGLGVGRQLFRAAAALAGDHGARWMDVETQNVNVPACRFYARLGCVLAAIDRLAYPDLLHEARLLWRFDVRTPV